MRAGRIVAAALASALLASADAGRAFVLGGGVADKDCRLAVDGLDATAGASGVVCRDGDPCDQDGIVDGVCRFDLRLCVGVDVPGCDPVTLGRVEVGGIALAPPLLPAADGTCGTPAAVSVATGGAVGSTMRGYLGGELREVDYLNVCCVSAIGPFDAAACAVGVDPAVSGCATVPERARRRLARAAEWLAQASADPSAARRPLKKAARLAGRVRGIGQKIARHDDCGFALGLLGSHAHDVLVDSLP
jgi:hypothetical protein